MRVGIDQARHQRHPGPVDELVARLGSNLRADRGDQPRVAPHPDGIAVEKCAADHQSHAFELIARVPVFAACVMTSARRWSAAG